MGLFPYPPRPSQLSMMQSIAAAFENGRHIVLEAGTGTGKTITALTPAVEHAISTGRKVIYATRTNSQQEQALCEIRELAKKAGGGFYGVGVQGRSNCCPYIREKTRFSDGSPEELSRLCAGLKKRTMDAVKAGGEFPEGCCSHFASMLKNTAAVEAITGWARKNSPTVPELMEKCREKSICPYELNKLLVSDAIMVAVPYVYVFHERIRPALLQWMKREPKELILIVDEAHNLADYCRDTASAKLSLETLRRAESEARRFGNPVLLERERGCVNALGFCNTLSGVITGIRDDYLRRGGENAGAEDAGAAKLKDERDALIPDDELEFRLMESLAVPSPAIKKMLFSLSKQAELIRSEKQRKGELPRSYLGAVSAFVLFWLDAEAHEYAKLAVDSIDGGNPHLEVYCLDPSLAGGVACGFHASLHMSGTLSPLDEYRDSIGLPSETELLQAPSPFPPEHRLVLFSGEVSTRYQEMRRDSDMQRKIDRHIVELCNSVPVNTVVFFPSYRLMYDFLDGGVNFDIERTVYIEKRDTTQDELAGMLELFRGHANGNGGCGGVMFSVLGGRVSEGLDFPDRELEMVIMVGLPYPPPSARQRALENYYDVKFGKGWDYTVQAPVARKLLQGIGRLIRSEKDRGVAVVLDSRLPRFSQYLPDMRLSDDIARAAAKFFGSRNR